jgi:N-acetylglucosaminyl-diphospho-decaprenol L-rhamnosyltransferase
VTADVVIVHYGPADVTASAVAAALRTGWPVTVVDNDGGLDLEDDPRLNVLRPGANLGFARAVNLGVRQGASPWILMLNPDTEPDPGALEQLLAIAGERGDTAVLAPTLVYRDGSPQIGGGRFAGWVRELGRMSGIGRRLRAQRAQIASEFRSPPDGVRATIDRQWVSGAVMLVRRSAFEEVAGFDERFFLYYEDEDLCRRLRARGWRVAVAPEVRVKHAVMGMQADESSQEPAAAYERSRAVYHQIHSGPLLRRIVGWDSARRERALR